MRLTTLLMILCFSVLSVFAREEPIIIKGIVKDKETNQSIPFAHVIIGSQVTISNINGEFTLPIEYQSDTEFILEVSYLGYESYSQVISNFDAYFEVFITSSLTELDEIIVTSGPQIMERVFNNFHLNYVMEPLHLETYYLESLRDSIGFQYVTEGIIDVYTPSNVDRYGIPWAHLRQSRKRIYKPVESNNFLAGNASDMAHHSIWRFDSFLSKRNRDKYEYYYDGTGRIGLHDVLIIEFEPKNKKGTTSGKLYIDDITFAILKMEYHPNTTRSDFWDYVYWTEEFELIDGSFELVNVEYEGHADQGQQKYEAVLVINNATVNYDIPEDKILLSSDKTLFEVADDTKSAESFWQGYYSIKFNDRVEVQIMSDRYGFEY